MVPQRPLAQRGQAKTFDFYLGDCGENNQADFLHHYSAHKSKRLNVSEPARDCNISRTTVYKHGGFLEA